MYAYRDRDGIHTGLQTCMSMCTDVRGVACQRHAPGFQASCIWRGEGLLQMCILQIFLFFTIILNRPMVQYLFHLYKRNHTIAFQRNRLINYFNKNVQ